MAFSSSANETKYLRLTAVNVAPPKQQEEIDKGRKEIDKAVGLWPPS